MSNLKPQIIDKIVYNTEELLKFISKAKKGSTVLFIDIPLDDYEKKKQDFLNSECYKKLIKEVIKN